MWRKGAGARGAGEGAVTEHKGPHTPGEESGVTVLGTGSRESDDGSSTDCFPAPLPWRATLAPQAQPSEKYCSRSQWSFFLQDEPETKSDYPNGHKCN